MFGLRSHRKYFLGHSRVKIIWSFFNKQMSWDVPNIWAWPMFVPVSLAFGSHSLIVLKVLIIVIETMEWYWVCKLNYTSIQSGTKIMRKYNIWDMYCLFCRNTNLVFYSRHNLRGQLWRFFIYLLYKVNSIVALNLNSPNCYA